jgi:hypothetical protein
MPQRPVPWQRGIARQRRVRIAQASLVLRRVRWRAGCGTLSCRIAAGSIFPMGGGDPTGEDRASAGAQPAPHEEPVGLAEASEDVRRLYAYWQARRGAKRFPAREDIDPVDFKFALGRVSLVDVLEDPRRYRYRLVSTSITKHLGYEMTGKYSDEIPEKELRDYVERLYAKTVTVAAPIYEKEKAILDGRLWEYEALMLPLSSDGSRINMIMAFRETAVPRTLLKTTGDR